MLNVAVVGESMLKYAFILKTLTTFEHTNAKKVCTAKYK